MEYFLSLLSGGASGAILVWLSKNWISERLKQSIGHEYSRKLEQHKHDYSQDLERLRSELNVQLERAKHYNQVSQLRTSLFFDHQRSAFAALIKKTIELNEEWTKDYDPREGLYSSVPRSEYNELVSLFHEHQLFLDDECLVFMTMLMDAYTDSYPYFDGMKTHYNDNSEVFEFVEYIIPRMASIFRSKIGIGDNSVHLQQIIVLSAMTLINGINLQLVGLDFPPSGVLHVKNKHRAADIVKDGIENLSELERRLAELDKYLNEKYVGFVDIQLKVRRCLGVMSKNHNGA
ncbi:hypothetical protein [Pseudomonas sp. RL_105y_Pfl1_103]|uniref:hypothetical protein n=1 Tax=Pseudomonas sp. RL_105y_Pfl1_103 TaxID=3088707 RepID=UPI0030DC8EB1